MFQIENVMLTLLKNFLPKKQNHQSFLDRRSQDRQEKDDC